MIIYVYKLGDTLWEISTAFGISLDTLILANPQIKDANEIMPGEQIYIPQASTSLTKTSGKKVENTTSITENQLPFIYVSPGKETIWQISKRFKLDYSLLKGSNKHLQNRASLKKGDKVFIPQLKPGQGLAVTANTAVLNTNTLTAKPHKKTPAANPQNKPLLSNNYLRPAGDLKYSRKNDIQAPSLPASSRPWVSLEEVQWEDAQISSSNKGAIIICPHCSKSLNLPKSFIKE